MTKFTLLSLILLTVGLVLWAWYAAQGSFVDENGVLQEPFALLALGWLFVLAGGAMLVGVVGVKMIAHFRSPK